MRRLIFLLLLLLPMLFGCNEEASDELYDIQIYALNADETELTSYGYNFVAYDTAARISELISRLQISDKDGNYFSAIAQSVPLKDWTLSEKGILTCYFGSEYYSMKNTKEILSRAAIVKTFCQISDIFGVEFIIGEEALKIQDSIVGIMTEDLFLMDIGLSTIQADVTLFFAAEDMSGLVPVDCTLYSEETKTVESLVLQALVDGPEAGSGVATLPSGTKINRVTTKDSICYIDLSNEFLSYSDTIPPHLTVYSIVNSLSDLDYINSVVITVDGQTQDKYLTVDISSILECNLDYVISSNEEE